MEFVRQVKQNRIVLLIANTSFVLVIQFTVALENLKKINSVLNVKKGVRYVGIRKIVSNVKINIIYQIIIAKKNV